MDKEVEKLIQVWVDWKFGIPNHFNTKLLLDFLKFAEEKLGYLPVEAALPEPDDVPEWAGARHLNLQPDEELPEPSQDEVEAVAKKRRRK